MSEEPFQSGAPLCSWIKTRVSSDDLNSIYNSWYKIMWISQYLQIRQDMLELWIVTNFEALRKIKNVSCLMIWLSSNVDIVDGDDDEKDDQDYDADDDYDDDVNDDDDDDDDDGEDEDDETLCLRHSSLCNAVTLCYSNDETLCYSIDVTLCYSNDVTQWYST